MTEWTRVQRIRKDLEAVRLELKRSATAAVLGEGATKQQFRRAERDRAKLRSGLLSRELCLAYKLDNIERRTGGFYPEVPRRR